MLCSRHCLLTCRTTFTGRSLVASRQSSQAMPWKPHVRLQQAVLALGDEVSEAEAKQTLGGLTAPGATSHTKEREMTAPGGTSHIKEREVKEITHGYTGLLPVTVTVVFKLKRPCKPGEGVAVLGDISELSKWNTKDIRVLLTYEEGYKCWHDYGYGPDGPLWYGKARLPWGQEFEFKFVLVDVEKGNALSTSMMVVVGPDNMKLKVDLMEVLEMKDVCVEVHPASGAEATLEEIYACMAIMEARKAEEYRKEAARCKAELLELQMAHTE